MSNHDYVHFPGPEYADAHFSIFTGSKGTDVDVGFHRAGNRYIGQWLTKAQSVEAAATLLVQAGFAEHAKPLRRLLSDMTRPAARPLLKAGDFVRVLTLHSDEGDRDAFLNQIVKVTKPGQRLVGIESASGQMKYVYRHRLSDPISVIPVYQISVIPVYQKKLVGWEERADRVSSTETGS